MLTVHEPYFFQLIDLLKTISELQRYEIEVLRTRLKRADKPMDLLYSWTKPNYYSRDLFIERCSG